MLIQLSLRKAPNWRQIEDLKKGVDSEIRLLVLKLNHLFFLKTDYTCSGHVQNNVGLYHRGISFYLDLKNPTSTVFLGELEELIAGFEFVSLEDGLFDAKNRKNYEIEIEDLYYFNYEVDNLNPKTKEEFRACNYEKVFNIYLRGIETVTELRALGKRKGSRNFLTSIYDQTYRVFNESFETLIDSWLDRLGITLPTECFILKERGEEEGRNGHPWIEL